MHSINETFAKQGSQSTFATDRIVAECGAKQFVRNESRLVCEWGAHRGIPDNATPRTRHEVRVRQAFRSVSGSHESAAKFA